MHHLRCKEMLSYVMMAGHEEGGCRLNKGARGYFNDCADETVCFKVAPPHGEYEWVLNTEGDQVTTALLNASTSVSKELVRCFVFVLVGGIETSVCELCICARRSSA